MQTIFKTNGKLFLVNN